MISYQHTREIKCWNAHIDYFKLLALLCSWICMLLVSFNTFTRLIDYNYKRIQVMDTSIISNMSWPDSCIKNSKKSSISIFLLVLFSCICLRRACYESTYFLHMWTSPISKTMPSQNASCNAAAADTQDASHEPAGPHCAGKGWDQSTKLLFSWINRTQDSCYFRQWKTFIYL